MKLMVDELIYTRVELKYSPRRFSGWQVLYRSPGLTGAEEQEIEDRVQCFKWGESSQGLRKLQFFRLSTGRYFVGSSTPVIHPYLDRDRGGTFIAHGFAITAEDLARLDNNPFRILHEEQWFVTNAETMVQQYSQKPPPPQVALTFKHDRRSWLDEEEAADAPKGNATGPLRQIITIALQARAMVARDESVFVCGSAHAIGAYLEQVFAVVPKDKRPYLTFSTHTDRCERSRNTYWAMGTQQKEPSDSRACWIDLATEQVHRPDVGARGDSTSYDRWLNSAIHRLEWQDLCRLSTIMDQTLAAVDRGGLQGLVIPQTAAQEVVDFLGLPSLQSRVASWLGSRFSADAAADLAAFLQDREPLHRFLAMAIEPEAELNGQLHTIAPKWLVQMLRDDRLRHLAAEDWLTLARLPGGGELKFLLTVLRPASRWERWVSSRARTAERLEALAQLSPEAFTELLEECGPCLSADLFLCRKHGRQFAEWVVSQSISSDEAAPILDVILSGDREFPADVALKLVAVVSRRHARRLLERHASSPDRRLLRGLARRYVQQTPPSRLSWLFGG